MTNYFFTNKNQVKADNSSTITDSQKDQSSTLFNVLLLGGYKDSKTIDLFLENACIKIEKKYIHHFIKNNEMTFVLSFYMQANRLVIPHLVKSANLILVLPDDEDDFYFCTQILRTFDESLSKNTKIFCFFPEESPKYSAIIGQAETLGYEKIKKNEIKSLLENAQKEYLRQLDNPDNEAITKQDNTDNRSFQCYLL